MSEKHTAGPWTIFPGNYHASFVVPETDLHKKLGGASDSNEDLTYYAQEVCVIDRNHKHRSAEEQLSNARLIASAPDLLCALQNAAPALCLLWGIAHSTGVDKHLPGMPRIIEDVRIAIAKAIGENK